MTTNVQTFSFASGMSLQAIVIDGQPRFIAKSVCDALDIVNGRDAVASLDADERETVAISYGTPGNPNRTVISESGLYSLIFRSQKPEARKFRKWVTSDVLPALRTGGVYVVGQEKVDLAAMSYAESLEYIEGLKAKVAEATAIQWAKSREDRNDYRQAMKFFGRRTGRKAPRKVARK